MSYNDEPQAGGLIDFGQIAKYFVVFVLGVIIGGIFL